MYFSYQNLIRFFIFLLLLYTNFDLFSQLEDSLNPEEIVEINLNQIQENLLNAPEEFSLMLILQVH